MRGAVQISFPIRGMYCAKCAVRAETALARLDGVIAAHVNYATERATVTVNPAQGRVQDLVRVVRGEELDIPISQVRLPWAQWRRLGELSPESVVSTAIHWRRGCIELQVISQVNIEGAAPANMRSLVRMLWRQPLIAEQAAKVA